MGEVENDRKACVWQMNNQCTEGEPIESFLGGKKGTYQLTLKLIVKVWMAASEGERVVLGLVLCEIWDPVSI